MYIYIYYLLHFSLCSFHSPRLFNLKFFIMSSAMGGIYDGLWVVWGVSVRDV